MTIDRTAFESIYAGQSRWEIGRPKKAFFDVADQITGSTWISGAGQAKTHSSSSPAESSASRRT